MQKIILFTVVLFSFAACSLDKLEPAQTDAFMKFFGDVGNTDGVDLLKLDDGYLLLGNNKNGDVETAVLIKTDLNGNQIWSEFFENISGSALARDDNSYFIVGDSIDTSEPILGNPPPVNKMILIKTDLDGGNHQIITLGVTGVPYHGTGITVSNTGEVVVCGFIKGLSGTDTTFLYGYNNLLVPTWTDVRKWWTDADNRISSRTLIQNDNNNFVFTTIYGSDNSIETIVSEGDTPEFVSRDLLKDFNSTADLGDFYENSNDNNNGILVQTVDNGKKNIAMVTYNSTSASPPIIIGDVTKNYEAASVVQASDGDFVILGSTDKHSDSRTDSDFYITKVGFDGTISTLSGFENFIGGTGDETGAAMVQADDRGFVFLGTMENTNKVKFMVLVKVNIRGEMIN